MKITEKMKAEVCELARSLSPSVIRCTGSPHRPECNIPLYHNRAEEVYRNRIVKSGVESLDPFDVKMVEAGIENWCIYCIISHPELNKMFPRTTSFINKRALKGYDSKYQEDGNE